MAAWFLLGTILLLLGHGCRKSSAELDLIDEKNPVFQKASRKAQEGDFEAAIELYREALRTSPQSAKAHLQLGMIYDDVYTNRVRAIYHYDRYLELRPDAEKRDLVTGWIDRLRRELAASALSDSGETGAESEVMRLRQKVLQLSRQIQELQLDRQRLRKALLESSEMPAPAVSAPADRGPAPPGEIGSKPVRRTYTVVQGDTLQGIAKKVYGSVSLWRRIYDANRDTIKSPERLRPGMVLLIPEP